MNPDGMIEHVAELMRPMGTVRVKRMFGGHGIYIDELFVAIMASQRLYLKTDEQTFTTFAQAGCTPFVYDGHGKPATMKYWTVPDEALESPQTMRPWATLAIDAALRARTQRATPRPRVRRGAEFKP